MKKLVLAALSVLAGTAHGQTQEQVGDLDSFGRGVIYLGLANTRTYKFAEDCAPLTAQGFICTVPVAQPGVTSFRFDDLASIQLPARVTNSLLCFTLTPSVGRTFSNKTAAATTAQVNFLALLSIESTVLANANAINPATGLPLNGKLELTAVARSEAKRLQPGDFESDSWLFTRSCQNALVSKRSLVEQYGLTAAQATAFFNTPITVRIGLSGQSSLMTFGSFGYGIRLYGDKR